MAVFFCGARSPCLSDSCPKGSSFVANTRFLRLTRAFLADHLAKARRPWPWVGRLMLGRQQNLRNVVSLWGTGRRGQMWSADRVRHGGSTVGRWCDKCHAVSVHTAGLATCTPCAKLLSALWVSGSWHMQLASACCGATETLCKTEAPQRVLCRPCSVL